MKVDALNKDTFLINVTLSGLAKNIREKIHEQKYFTYSISDPDLRAGKVHLYLISLDQDKLNYLAMGVKIGRTTSGQDSIKLSKLVDLGSVDFRNSFPPGPLAESYVRKASEEIAMRVAANYCDSIIDFLVNNDPSIFSATDKLIKLINGDDIYEGDPKAEIFSLQKDATRSVLQSFGLKYGDVFGEWDEESYNGAKSYAEGLPKRYMREDEMAFRDARHFEGFQYIDDIDVTTLVFERRGHRIKITYANRAKAESLIGVDLVYANEPDDSFTFVQYKRLTEEGGGNYRYRPRGDGNHAAELNRMIHFRNQLNTIPILENLSNYRFSQSPFFFKFCKSIIFDPRANSSIEGFYMSLEAWILFLKNFPDGEPKPPVASEGTCKRIFNNQTFCHLLSNGLIGSHAIHSRVIAPILNAAMENNRSLIYASHERVFPERKKATGTRKKTKTLKEAE
jgi:hypothetical protein